MRRLTILTSLLLALTLAVACGGGGDDGDSVDDGATSEPTASSEVSFEGVQPVGANSELVVGENRFNLGLLTADNKYINGPDIDELTLRFYFGGEPRDEQPARFVWATEGESGIFVANTTFDQAGEWEVEPLLTANGEAVDIARGRFTVLADGSAPTIGDAAPPTENATASSEPNMAKLTTDPEPNDAFYEMTVAQALEDGKPFVVVFATPAFCQTRFCGPILDNVKAVQPDFADRANFIHIEPYNLNDDGSLATDEQGFPVAAPPTQEWGLRREPWIFVVDTQGNVSARFEGAVDKAELSAAIEAAGAAA
jgi:hypothetical protein